jgi:alpha-tubulin suppressor-like RCC1 family protein
VNFIARIFCKGKKRTQGNDDINLNTNLNNYIFSWGDNTYSQYGLDNNEFTFIESPKMIFKEISIKNISLGNNHTIILTNNGEVIIFGDNQFLQCSNDENKNIIKEENIINDNNIMNIQKNENNNSNGYFCQIHNRL